MWRLDLKELGLIDPRTHWYYQTKLFVLRWVLRRFAPDIQRLVDVGSGSGFLASELVNFDSGQRALCIDPNYPRESVEHDGALRFVQHATQADLVDSDTFLFIDVLEHVDDDLGLLQQYLASARRGSTVVITVPAFQSMWSAHDVYLEHLRRYRMSGLVAVVERAGLTIVHRRYLFASIFPAAWVVRWFRRTRSAASDLQPVPSVVNGLLRVVLNAEHRLGWNKLFGLSILVVAKVP